MQATQALVNSGLVVGEITTQNSATIPPNEVISQNPIAESQVQIGVGIDLVVRIFLVVL